MQMNQRKRSVGLGCLSGFVLLCGMVCAFITIVGVFFLPRLPGLIAQNYGLEAAGETAALFQDTVSQPIPTLANAAALAQVQVVAVGVLQEQIVASEQIQIQVSGNHEVGAQIRIQENVNQGLCEQLDSFCLDESSGFRNLRADFKTNGGIIYVESNISGWWQVIGIVFELKSEKTIRALGLDVNGQFYLAPSGDLAVLMTEAESRINEIFNQLSIESDGIRYLLKRIHLGEDFMILDFE
ncbi:hypothetical protein MASR2M15_01360 [Anaerolineales bacterium]